MGSLSAETKPHLVLMPYPAQGHVTPMMMLAKLLHSRGFFITYVSTEFNHRRLIRAKGPDSVKGFPGFRFETIPDGLPASDEDATQDIPMLCQSIRNNFGEPFRKLLSRLNSATADGQPPVSCVVSDGVMTFSIGVAKEMGIPAVSLWTASACALMGYLHYQDFLERGIVPFKNENYLTDGTLDAPLDWVTGLKNVQLKDIPSFIRTTDLNDIMLNYLKDESQNNLKADCIMFNNFYELEQESLDALKSKFNFSNIHTIGPLCLLEKQVIPENHEYSSLNSSLWKPDSKVLEWLDGQKPESVIYVNYGSITTMTAQHLQEFAWGLAKSERPFLWVVRRDVVKGESAVLSEEFLDEIKDRGLLVDWCAQERVLKHEAVGAFLTHCGWNSMMETISAGVPVICWPFFADQQTNCCYSCKNWGIGMEINSDVKRWEVEGLVREMMVGEKGREMRKNAREWKKKAEAAVEVGGCSYVNFNKLVEELLLLLHHHQD